MYSINVKTQPPLQYATCDVSVAEMCRTHLLADKSIYVLTYFVPYKFYFLSDLLLRPLEACKLQSIAS